jgi:hypothetical protein
VTLALTGLYIEQTGKSDSADVICEPDETEMGQFNVMTGERDEL